MAGRQLSCADDFDEDIDEAQGAVGTVLVADGDPTHRVSVAEMLLAQGYSVVLASTQEEVLSRVAAGVVDLVVTSLTLAGTDALELLRTLRDNMAELPVIVVASGMSEMDGLYLKGASLLGAARAYTQPLTPSVFLESVRELMRPRDA